MDAPTTLQHLQSLQTTHPLSILTLSAPILTTGPQRCSSSSLDPSSDISDPTPTSLLADLAHYKDLFSKLRFSYLEQVTKEKYLRSIVGEPPVLVSYAENVELEARLVGLKAGLKGRKVEVGVLVGEMEGVAERLAGRWEGVREGMGALEELPGRIEGLEERVRELRKGEREGEGWEERDADPRMNLGLEETQSLIAEQTRRSRELEAQIREVQRVLPGKMRECEGVEGELERLERRRDEVARLAAEARRVMEEGGRDEMEGRGRWYGSAETVLRGLVGVDA